MIRLLAILSFAGPAASATPGQAAKVFAQLRPLVFQVKTAISASAPKNSYGTGFVVGRDGLVVTNYHVVADSILEPERYRVYLVDGANSLPTEVLRVSAVNDLALLRVKRSFSSRVEIAKDMPDQGAPIYSLGMPEDLNMSIVEGTYNGVIQEGPYSKIHMSSPINAGMSGGPTVDASGRLVGVNVSRLLFSNNVSFAVPKKNVGDLLTSWTGGPTAPTAIEFEELIGKQLKAAGASIYDSLRHLPAGSRKFGSWRVPAVPQEIRCWSDRTPADKEKKYSVVSENCFLMNNSYLGHGVGSGEFAMELRECVSKDLNQLQFFELLNDNYEAATKTSLLGSNISRRMISEFTAPVCSSRKVKNAHGIPMMVHACVKEFVRYAGVYESAVDLVTLSKGRRNLTLKAGFSGLTYESTEDLIRFFIDSVSVDEGGHAED